MNRSSFLKRLGIGTAAIIASPSIIEAMPKKKDAVILSGRDVSIALERNTEPLNKDVEYSPHFVTLNSGYATLFNNGVQVAIFRDVQMELKQELIDVTDRYKHDGWIKHIQGK